MLCSLEKLWLFEGLGFLRCFSYVIIAVFDYAADRNCLYVQFFMVRLLICRSALLRSAVGE